MNASKDALNNFLVHSSALTFPMRLNILLFSFLLDRYHKMVLPQIGDNRGGSLGARPRGRGKRASCPRNAILASFPVRQEPLSFFFKSVEWSCHYLKCLNVILFFWVDQKDVFVASLIRLYHGHTIIFVDSFS